MFLTPGTAGPLITPLTLEVERLRTCRDLEWFSSVVTGVGKGGADSGLPDLLRDPALECLVKVLVLSEWQCFVLLFLSLFMGKYISSDDGYGDEKKEMLN